MPPAPVSFDPAQFHILGNTGIRVSPLGLGTVKLGRNQALKYPLPFDLPGDEQVSDLLCLVRDLGINLIDTAPAYGDSEVLLGKWLPRPLDKWIISTKAGENFSQGQSTFDFSARAIARSVESSLKRLQRDYIDLLMLHSDGGDHKILADENLILALEKLKQEGKIRACGISSKTTEGGLLGADLLDIVMITPEEQEVIEHAHQKGKGILIKKPLDSGHISTPASRLSALAADPRITATVVGTLSGVHLQKNVAAML